MKRSGCIVVLSLLFPLLLVLPVWASDGDSNGFDLVDFLLGGLQDLFIPDSDFLSDWQGDILDRFDDKFGSVRGGLGYLSDRFQSLREYRGLDDIFTVAFPRGSFLYGIRMNLLEPAKDVLLWVRFCMTGFAVIATVLFCFHRAKSMLDK